MPDVRAGTAGLDKLIGEEAQIAPVGHDLILYTHGLNLLATALGNTGKINYSLFSGVIHKLR